ncbi:MAG: DUF1189 family protein [Patescibacteria group bacterium]
MKTFFTNIGRSVYGPAMYQELPSKPFSFSLKQYIKFALLASLVVTVVLAFKAAPLIRAALGDFSSKLAESYPADLEIKLTQGQVSVNQPEPYYVPLPAGDEFEVNDKSYQNLLVIDTKRSFDLATFQKYQTVAWVMKDSVAMYKSNGTVQFIPLEGVPDTTINRELVRSLGSKINPIAKVIPFIAVPFIFIAGLFYFAYQMLYLLIGALLVWLLLTIMKRKVGYGTAYQVGLHAMTLGIIISALDLMIGANLHLIPLQFTILLLVIVGINFAGAHQPVVTEVSSTPNPAA